MVGLAIWEMFRNGDSATPSGVSFAVGTWRGTASVLEECLNLDVGVPVFCYINLTGVHGDQLPLFESIFLLIFRRMLSLSYTWHAYADAPAAIADAYRSTCESGGL